MRFPVPRAVRRSCDAGRTRTAGRFCFFWCISFVWLDQIDPDEPDKPSFVPPVLQGDPARVHSRLFSFR
jgi:hypothetical protein